MKGLSCLLAIYLGFSFFHAEAKAPKMMDLADTVAANKIMTKFAAVIQSSDLVTFLSSKGPFTLFVPTDAAFARMPPATLDALLRPENKERLQHILLFHLVNGKRLYAKDLLAQTTLLSCEGNPLTIKTSKSGTQYVMKARITHADIRCQNGVIHEIDTVLMPPAASLPPLAPPPPPAPPAPPVDPNAPAGATPTDTNAAPITPVISGSPSAAAAPIATNALPAAPVAPMAPATPAPTAPATP
jgi:uncharacterized surface protein with fasciclin (FAS1) repeats